MIKFENTEVVGWEAAIRGLRNPLNSWDKSDSHDCAELACKQCPFESSEKCGGETGAYYVIGQNDLDLMKRLRSAGTDHRKYLRMITVYVDITAPLYWWKEFDTYKVGTVANSCSTMHKIHAKEFTIDDFSHEHLSDKIMHSNLKACDDEWVCLGPPTGLLESMIDMLNACREEYLKTKDKKYWWQMIQLLPSSYNQKRTVMINYETLNNIYKSRKNHKLDEWSKDFMEWIESLPYAKELIVGEE